jgi:hypothetical protein
MRGKAVTSIVLMITTSLSPSAEIPRCVLDLQHAESGARPVVEAPSITPTFGRTSTTVTISGRGFEPRARLVVAALYGERDCKIEGLGDEFLGTARSGTDGAYSLIIRWPARFVPVLGRDAFPTVPLPRGRYYVVVMPCTAPAACSFSAGSHPGGPFVLGERDPPSTADADAPAGMLPLAVGFAILSFGIVISVAIILVRRRRRSA